MQDRFVKQTIIILPGSLLESCENEEFSGKSSISPLVYSSNEFLPIGDVEWKVSVSRVDKSLLFVSGEATSTFRTKCVRCLEDAEILINAGIEGYVICSNDAKLPDDVEESECIFLEKNKHVDISPLIESALLLELPPNPICKSDCEGLFRFVDVPLNEDASTNSPFEVLKNYKF